MADLVTLDELRTALGDPSADPEILGPLLTGVEALFLAACGRADRPFQAAEAARTEVLDGTGSALLWLAYPISTLTSITLGLDPTHPDEILDVTDPTVLIYTVGSRRVVRLNGLFGWGRWPQYVHVLYTTSDDRPDLAQHAVLEMASALYRQRGSEGVTTERLGEYSVELAVGAARLPSWQAAIDHYRAVLV